MNESFIIEAAPVLTADCKGVESQYRQAISPQPSFFYGGGKIVNSRLLECGDEITMYLLRFEEERL